MLPPNLVKNKIQLSELEDPIGFIKWFVNRAASHVGPQRALPELFFELREEEWWICLPFGLHSIT